jgi:hypothetical protein
MGKHSLATSDSSGLSSPRTGASPSQTGPLPCECATVSLPVSLPTDSISTRVLRAQPKITYHHGDRKYRVYEDDGYTQWPTSIAARARFDQIRRWRQADSLTDQA